MGIRGWVKFKRSDDRTHETGGISTLLAHSVPRMYGSCPEYLLQCNRLGRSLQEHVCSDTEDELAKLN